MVAVVESYTCLEAPQRWQAEEEHPSVVRTSVQRQLWQAVLTGSSEAKAP